jgi:hypothetical protein
LDASVRYTEKTFLCKLFILFVYRNKEVFVDKWQEKVIIIGIDEYGFLKVRKSSNGEVVTLHTDAHSFDVRQSIIREKAI